MIYGRVLVDPSSAARQNLNVISLNPFEVVVVGLLLFISYSAGIDCRRQILTSTVDPRAVRVNIFIYNIC